MNNSTGPVELSPSKPLLRGWIHAVAAIAAAVLTLALCVLSRDDVTKLLSMLVFGLSMTGLYSISAVYHIGNWREKPSRVLRALDHSGIYVLIAGTYTPLCVNVLAGTQRTIVLLIIWIMAALGTAYSVLTISVPKLRARVPRKLNTLLYIGMGWVSLLVMPTILVALPWQATALLLLGGAINTAGGIVYARRRPDPFPRVLGFHEIFHLLVVAGGAVFSLVVWIWVLPYPRV